jgi:hypothetical protein
MPATGDGLRLSCQARSFVAGPQHVDPRSHRKKEIGACLLLNCLRAGGRPRRQDVMRWCAIKEHSRACIALQVKAKESNIQRARARARGVRKKAKKVGQGLVWWVTSDAPSARQLSPITFSSISACSHVLFAPGHTAHAARQETCHRPRCPWPQGVEMARVRVVGGDVRTCSQTRAGGSGGKQVVASTRARPTRYRGRKTAGHVRT